MVGCKDDECLEYTFAQDGEQNYAINPEFNSKKAAAKAWNTRVSTNTEVVSALQKIRDVHNGLPCDLGNTTIDICEQALANAGINEKEAKQ